MNTSTITLLKKITGSCLLTTLFCLSIQSNDVFANTAMVNNHLYIGANLGMANSSSTLESYKNTNDDAGMYRVFAGYQFAVNNKFFIGPEIGYFTVNQSTQLSNQAQINNTLSVHEQYNIYGSNYSSSADSTISESANKNINNTTALTTNGIELLANLSYKFNSKFHGFSKFGAAIMKQTVENSENTTSSFGSPQVDQLNYSGSFFGNNAPGFKQHLNNLEKQLHTKEKAFGSDDSQSQTTVTSTHIVPEIVLGLGWDVTQHLSLNASATHFFGAKSLATDLKNPATLDIYAIGVQYNF